MFKKSQLQSNVAILFVMLLASFAVYSLGFNDKPNLYQDPLDRPIKKNTPSDVPLKIVTIKPDLYLITGRGANAVLRRTDEGLILVDNKVQYNLVWRELVEIINTTVGNLPIKYSFITHHHADHGGLNQQVIDTGSELIGHQNLIETLKIYTSIIAPYNPAPPTITFTDKYTLNFAGTTTIAYYLGSGHTNGDIAVYFTDLKVIAGGDLIYGNGMPSVDAHYGQGTIFGILSQLDRLLELDFELVVPGHGNDILTREQVVQYRTQIQSLIEISQAAIRKGLSPEKVVELINQQKMGFTLTGHFWHGEKYLRPIYEELKASINAPPEA